MTSPRAAGEYAGSIVDPLRLASALRRPPMQELDVYHGTPHRFPSTEANPLGELDASKIGTGEGAQAYGHGIYLAESPGVAGSYAQSVKANSGELIKRGISHGVPEDVASNLVSALQSGKKFDSVVDGARAMLNDPLTNASQRQAAQRLLDSEMEAYNAWSEWSKPGSLYTLDLPDEMIDRMLDWDKPLSEQPEAVRAAIQKIASLPEFRNGMLGEAVQPFEMASTTGQTVQNLLSRYFNGNNDKVSALLSRAGIPGIRYLDAGSRGDTDVRTRNFVVFPGEEKKVKILRRE
jgi:hypothetical protein